MIKFHNDATALLKNSESTKDKIEPYNQKRSSFITIIFIFLKGNTYKNQKW